jgi:hypothetical protein
MVLQAQFLQAVFDVLFRGLHGGETGGILSGQGLAPKQGGFLKKSALI